MRGALVALVVTVVVIVGFGTTFVMALPNEVERRFVVERTFQRIPVVSELEKCAWSRLQTGDVVYIPNFVVPLSIVTSPDTENVLAVAHTKHNTADLVVFLAEIITYACHHCIVPNAVRNTLLQM